MADQDAQQREFVYCHSCSNEWVRDQHGLHCSRCQSEVVVIISRIDEPTVQHVEWNPAPGVRFSRTSYRSSSPMGRGQPDDPLTPLFQSISTIFEGANAHGRPQSRNIRPPIHHPSHIHRPEFATQNPFSNQHHHHVHHHHSPWAPGHGPPGGRQAFTATGRIWPQHGPNSPTNDRTINNLHR